MSTSLSAPAVDPRAPWLQSVACIEIPRELFLEAIDLARTSNVEVLGERHPAIRLLCDWWNSQRRSPHEAGFFEFIVRPNLRGHEIIYSDEDTGTDLGWRWLRQYQDSNASAGAHVIVIFLQSEIAIALANNGISKEVRTVFDEEFGGATWRLEELGDTGCEAFCTLEALAAFDRRFPAAYRELLATSGHTK